MEHNHNDLNEENTSEGITIKKDYTLPISILIAGVLIAGSLVYSAGKKSVVRDNQNVLDDVPRAVGAIQIKPISADDHVIGNPDALVKIIEFSDLECPFCKQFHATMKKVVQTYGDKVVWVYRHYPIPSLHSKAVKEAEASECAAELGGNQGFWSYLDALFAVTPSNNGLDPAELPRFAEKIGLNRTAFMSCLESGKYASRIAEQTKDAEASCTDQRECGTPRSIIIAPNGKLIAVPGAFPFENPSNPEFSMKKIIDGALLQK